LKLEQPQVIHKSFSIIDITEKAVVNDMSTEEQYIDIKGYASKMYMADGSYVIDADQENIDTFGIDLKRLRNGILPLLFNHDQKKAVGKILSATYDKDGLLITARLHKLPDDSMTNYVYQAVKAGIISSFSIGILVKDFEIVNQDDEEYLQLSRSEAIEISLVSVPSNPEATFQITSLKGFSISKSVLKAENSDACNSIECAFKALKGEEMITKNIEKETVIGVTPDAMDKLEEIMSPVEEVVVIVDDVPQVGDVVEEDTQGVDKTNDKPSEVVQEDPVVVEEVNVLEASLETISNLDISNFDFDQLEQIYEVLASMTEKIEEQLAPEVIALAQEALQNQTITAPAV
jgi:HK97 family phage prohead protease